MNHCSINNVYVTNEAEKYIVSYVKMRYFTVKNTCKILILKYFL